MADIIYLKHKTWKEAKPFSKSHALAILKNQKYPTNPTKFRNDWKQVSVKEHAEDNTISKPDKKALRKTSEL